MYFFNVFRQSNSGTWKSDICLYGSSKINISWYLLDLVDGTAPEEGECRISFFYGRAAVFHWSGRIEFGSLQWGTLANRKSWTESKSFFLQWKNNNIWRIFRFQWWKTTLQRISVVLIWLLWSEMGWNNWGLKTCDLFKSSWSLGWSQQIKWKKKEIKLLLLEVGKENEDFSHLIWK